MSETTAEERITTTPEDRNDFTLSAGGFMISHPWLQSFCVTGLRILADLEAAEGRNKTLERATRTREDYDLRCQDCGAAHNLDTSIPSKVWNEICRNPGAASHGLPEAEMLCTLCIDERLQKAGLTAEAEFYFVGTALRSRLYEDSHGDVQRLERELAAAEERAQKAEARARNLEQVWTEAERELSKAHQKIIDLDKPELREGAYTTQSERAYAVRVLRDIQGKVALGEWRPSSTLELLVWISELADHIEEGKA